MILHIFNPDHDIALAANLVHFTAPHAGRQLRSDLGWIPALWACDGDSVLVEDTDYAQRAYQRFISRHPVYPLCSVSWVDWQHVGKYNYTSVMPWGWNKALRATLVRNGVEERQLPSEAQLDAIRQLSHRRTAACLLSAMQEEGTTGQAVMCDTLEAVQVQISQWGHVVLKAPWSSSGRGIRFVMGGGMDSQCVGWVRNLLKSQGSVMVEPYYNKVRDFGMEFVVDGCGISCIGLSLFQTTHGAYTGNLLLPESVKEDIISHYISVDLLKSIQEKIIMSDLFQGYQGPFGVDMMIVKANHGYLLHPCVEINLRRTMGHVALAMTATDGAARVMRVSYEKRYKLKIRKLIR